MFPKEVLKRIIGDDVALSPEMIKNIETWQNMLNGQAPWCDEQIQSLRLEQVIVQEFANTCLNEMEWSISNDTLSKLFKSAIVSLNEEVQDGLGLGSLAAKPLGDDKVEFVASDSFIPIKFGADRKPTKSAFLQVKEKKDREYYIRIETHSLIDAGLIITNKAYRSNNLNYIGSEIPLDAEEEWINLDEEAYYPGVDRNIFGYYRNPRKNRIDKSACGVSIFEPGVVRIKKADIQAARLDWEFESGERAIHADTSVLNPNKPGINKLNKRLYRKMDIEDSGKLLDVFSPEFREQSIINGFNEYLRRVEQSVGLAFGDISDVSEVAKTATEVLHSKERKFNTVKAIENNLKTCLEDLVYGIAFHNKLTTSGYEFVCDFNDSILTDDESETQSMREDVAASIIRPELYIAKKYKVSENEAKKMMPKPEVPKNTTPDPYLE